MPNDLFNIAKEGNNASNSFANAKAQIGPPKCWFTRSSHIGGLGCKTTQFAQIFANNILRVGATSWGVIPNIYVQWQNNSVVLYGLPDPFRVPALPSSHSDAFGHFSTLDNLAGNPSIWASYPGQQ